LTYIINHKGERLSPKEKKEYRLETVRKLPRGFVPLHAVLLKNKKGELLLQQRSKFKPLWPLYWSNTSCTNVRPGETTLAAAQRSLWRELKLKAKLKYQKKFIYKAKYDRRHSEYEVDYVFTGVVAGKPRANKKEVADWRFIGPGEVKKLLRVRPEQFTPWFKLGIIKP